LLIVAARPRRGRPPRPAPQEAAKALSEASAAARAGPADAASLGHAAALCCQLMDARAMDWPDWRAAVVPYFAPAWMEEARAEEVARAFLAQ
jgi:hypothetical protein